MPFRTYFPTPRKFAEIKSRDEMIRTYTEAWTFGQNALADFAPIAWECRWFIENKSIRISLSIGERKALAKYALSDKDGPWIPSREGKTFIKTNGNGKDKGKKP